MLQSHTIDIAIAAVRSDRFIATDMKHDPLDGSVWPTLVGVQRLAGTFASTTATRPVSFTPVSIMH